MKLNAWELVTLEELLSAHLNKQEPETHYHASVKALLDKVMKAKPVGRRPDRKQAA